VKLFKLGKAYTSPEEKKRLRSDWALAVLSGILLAISFPPIPLYFFMFAALVPLFIVWNRRSGLGEINRITYLFGLVFSIITLYWVGSWQPDTDPFLMISGVAILFFNPILFLIPSTLFYFAKKLWNKKWIYFFVPMFWVTNEYVYSITDLKFPWLAFGHGLAYFKSFIQIAEFIGAHGITLLVVLINVFVFLLFIEYKENRKINYKILIPVILFIVLPIIWGNIKLNTFSLNDKTIRVGLIQPNFNPWKKWDAGNLSDQLNQYLELSAEAVDDGAELIVWPETALPTYFLSGNYDGDVNKLKTFTRINHVPVLTGMPHANFYFDHAIAPEDAKPVRNSKALYTSYNSVLLFDPNIERVERYGKIMLVPFGERVPFIDVIPILGDFFKWNVGISSWNVGKDTVVFQVPHIVDKENPGLVEYIPTAGVICIESIYADFIARFVQRGAQLIAVVTNDSWYGDSSGPYQHKEISVLRAIENRRSVVRAANGGISCLINPLGYTIKETKMYTRDLLVVDVVLENDLTFFTKYPMLVIRFSYLVSILLIIVFTYRKIIDKVNRVRKTS